MAKAMGKEVRSHPYVEAGTGPRSFRVLVSAFACRPESASEAAVGWSVVRELSRRHDVTVVTESSNEQAIRRVEGTEHRTGASFQFVSSSPLTGLGSLGFNADYYLWQWRALAVARRLLRDRSFDVAHHATYGRYWVPSFLAFLPIPYVFGPVGGGESTPPAFFRALPPAGRRFERIRSFARLLGESDPAVRRTIRRSAMSLASTGASAARLEKLGSTRVRVFEPIALSDESLASLGTDRRRLRATFRCVSSGRLLHWKGFDLGLRAFAEAAIEGAEYWILGDGPEEERLKRLADRLGIRERVRFFGHVPRSESIEKIADCDVLVHPSLHDSAGFVCLEAMAAGVPVVCLDTGGPAHLLREGGGVAVSTESPERARSEMAEALRRLAAEGEYYSAVSRDAVSFARTRSWRHVGDTFTGIYAEICS